MPNLRFAVIGGDLRQVYLANYLFTKGHTVIVYGLSHPQLLKGCIQAVNVQQLIAPNTHVVLPLPVTKDGVHLFITQTEQTFSIEQLKELITISNPIYCGVMPKELSAFCEYRHIPYYDLMADSAVAIRNGIATAEGAIAHAVFESNATLHQSNALVVGFGRCGKVLAHKLAGLDAHVTISARKPCELALAESYGYKAIHANRLKRNIGRFPFIFNTVPAPILTSDLLSKLSSNTVIIDIASVPGGTDFNYAKKHNICAKLCLGIPGKTAPKTSGEILAEAILNHSFSGGNS